MAWRLTRRQALVRLLAIIVCSVVSGFVVLYAFTDRKDAAAWNAHIHPVIVVNSQFNGECLRTYGSM